VRTPTSTLALLLGLSLALSCSTTRILESWKEPGLKASDLSFQHVVAIAALRQESQQRIAEDAIVAAAGGTKVTAAYTLVSQADRADTDRLRAVLQKHGIDGAITVRLIGFDERQTYVPGSYSYGGGYYGYYGRVGVPIYDPGYTRTDTYVKVETSLYNVTSGKLLWTGVSETLNPTVVDGAIRSIVEAARKQLVSEGLLP